MKCRNCGFEAEGDFKFCPDCGAGSRGEYEEYTPPESKNELFKQKLLGMVKDELFMVLCILQTVSVGASVLYGGMNVISILFTIFMWLVWSRARNGILDVGSMRRISGAVYATYVVSWVICGLLGVSAVIMLALSATIDSYVSDIYSALAEIGVSYLYDELIDIIREAGITTNIFGFVFIVLGVVMIIAAVAIALVNIFGTRKLHRFAKSLYIGAGSEDPVVVSANGAATWMLICGIFNGLSALSSLADISNSVMLLASQGCAATTYIIGYVIVKKHITSK